MNQSAIERGLFSSTSYKTLMDEEKKRGSYNIENITFPPIELRKSNYNYAFLDENGIVKKGSHVVKGDVVVGKILTKSDKHGNEEKVDCSLIIKHSEEGIVDRVYDLTTTNGYKMVKVVIRKQCIPEIGDKMACFDPDTEVLTDDGWKQIDTVTSTDKVGILEHDNIKYECPSDLQEYDYEGKMYQLESQFVDLTVTPNHRMWVKKLSDNGQFSNEFDFSRADGVFGKSIKYKKNINCFKPDEWIGNTFIIPPYIDGHGICHEELRFDMDDWLCFFGIWVTEGWSTNTEVTFISNKLRVRRVLTKCIDNMGLYIQKNNSVIVNGMETNCDPKLIIFNTQLASYMEQFSADTTNKYLPKWVWSLNQIQCQLLLESMGIGDGYVSKPNTYYTTSKQLADDITRLTIHAGYSSHCHVTATQDNYVITVIKTKLEPTIKDEHCKTKSQYDQSEQWIDYCGKVFCMTVRTGVIMVRKNGKPVWSGNSRAAQKGTCGMVFRQEDMPFTSEGISPDIIINPHCIPSRMTINQLMECILGKACVMDGDFGDATPFTSNSVDITEKLCDALGKVGYERHGWEQMYNGMTGEPIDAQMFIGPTYYQRLKHLVADKVHSRQSGHVTTLHRQPLSGRSREGGLRFGEMEKDCMIAHGVSRFLKERLFDQSDPYQVMICDVCGNFATTHTECKSCETDEVSRVNLPFSAKLLLQELNAMGIKTSIVAKK
jgi:hypothetical protein